MRLRAVSVLASCCVLSAGAAGCGGGGGGARTVAGDTLTIYSSLPLQGASRGLAEAFIAGETLALEEFAPGRKVGRWNIKYVSLDDSTVQNPGSADEGQTSQNARRAAADKTTVFYLGEYNSGGSKVSIPILNRGGIPQISPGNTYVGLTTDEPGSEPGEPDKYYPAGRRTYARVVPRDTVQGAALVSVMKKDGCRAVTLWNDGSTYGAGLARNVELSARQGGLAIEYKQRTDKTATNYRAVAAGIKGDCFLWSGVVGENGVQVFKDAAAACPHCRLYGPDDLASPAFTDPKKGGIPAEVGDRMKVTQPALGVKDVPKAAPVIAAFKKKYKGQTPEPYVLYGYETMALALDIIKRLGPRATDRAAVIRELFNTKDRESILGVYSIDANGDTTLTDYGLYEIKDGLATYTTKIVADRSLIPGG